jgi:hypothetical protein
MDTKLVEPLLIGWLRDENMINVYLRGRVCIDSVRWSLIKGEFLSLSFSRSDCFCFELFFTPFLGLPLFVLFVGLAAFPCSR